MVRFPNPRSRHPHHMYDMILGQPEFVKETLGRVREEEAAILGRPRHVLVTGCGTSFHAAMYGASLLQTAFGPGVAIHAVHAYDLLHGLPRVEGTTVIGVSHTGNTGTTNRALARVRKAGARTIGLCGVPESPMERAVDEVLVIGSVHDSSWANTMSYTTQLAAFARLATGTAGPAWREIEEALANLPSVLKKALACAGAVRRLAKEVARAKRVTFLGSGLDEITALEAALKIRETCGLPASGYHPEQFLHGPFLSVDRLEAIVALRSRDDGARVDALLRGLRATGARVATVGDGAGVDIRLPRTVRELRPILSVVPMQFLAYYAALERKENPDIMRSGIRRYRAGLELLFR